MGPRQTNAWRIFIAFAVLAAFFGCRPGKNTAVPGHLVGVWKTSAPKYADRSFEITENSIIFFTTGGGNVDPYPILNIETVREDGNTLYAISYRNHAGQEYKFSFSYVPAKGGVIRFKNQNHIEWTRRGVNS